MPEHTPAAGAVFLSYAREDADAVRRIADALRAFGVEVWFDQNELRGGDAWDQQIKTQIRTCTLCLPVISATTQARGEGYFRREWRIAVERTHDMAAGVPFLLPVVIDDTPESAALVPDEFMRVQWTRLPKGVPTPQFVEQVKKMLTAKSAGTSVREPAAMASRESAAPRKRTVPAWTFGAGFAVVVGIATAVYVANKPAPTPAAPAAAKPVAAPAAPELPHDKSIAVLPFTNMSEDKDSGFFADGVHEDILTNLALIRELRVVSRTSVMPYRTTAKSMRQIAQELGVTYILEGSVRRSGNKVRVTGQLIHAASDEHVWAQAYDRDLTDVFTIQAELSKEIAGALKAALSPEEKVLIARKPTENPAAYDAFLHARDVVNREGNAQGPRSKQIAFLEKAVALDPDFAQAWGALSDACAYWSFIGYDGREEKLARAKMAIDRAMQLAPDDPEIFSSLGTYYYYGFRDYARAAEQYERRARLQPNSAVVANSLSLILRRQGRWAQSLPYARRAAELDPANVSYQRNLLATLKAARRWDEVLVAQRRLAALLPESLTEAGAVAEVAFYASGSTKEMTAFFAGLTPAQLNSPEGISVQQSWALDSGNFAEAVRLDRLQPYYDGGGWVHSEQAYLAALAYFYQGDKAGAAARLGDYPAQLRAAVEREPNNYRATAFLGGMEALLGHKEEALRCVARIEELLPESRDALDGVGYALIRAAICDYVGEKERSLAEFTRLLRLPSPAFNNVHVLRTNCVSLKGDPRWEALLNDPANSAPLF